MELIRQFHWLIDDRGHLNWYKWGTLPNRCRVVKDSKSKHQPAYVHQPIFSWSFGRTEGIKFFFFAMYFKLFNILKMDNFHPWINHDRKVAVFLDVQLQGFQQTPNQSCCTFSVNCCCSRYTGWHCVPTVRFICLWTRKAHTEHIFIQAWT